MLIFHNVIHVKLDLLSVLFYNNTGLTNLKHQFILQLFLLYYAFIPQHSLF